MNIIDLKPLNQKNLFGYNDLFLSIINLYKKFISNIVFPIVKDITGETEFAYQTFPTFRVQLPNNVAIVINHYDSDDKHKHPTGEINFIYALTDMFDTNTVKVEKMPRSGEFESLEMKRGECISFNGNKYISIALDPT